MVKPAYCHIKTKVDEHISEYVRNNPEYGNKYSSWNDDVVAAKIQFYNQAHPDAMLEVEEENISEIAEKLTKYEEQQRKARYDKIHPDRKDVYQSIAKSLKALKRGMSYSGRKDAVDFLAYYFSRKLDIICNKYGVTREMAANGFSQNGRVRFGEFAIFESIFEDIQVQINKLYSLENPTEQDEDLLENYKHLLDNWEGLVSYAKVKLSLTEKLKLGNFFSYAKAMKVIDDVELDMEENSEELIKDPADRIKDDQIASFKKVSQVTRNLLSRIPALEKTQDDNGDWHYQRDEKGEPIIRRNRYGVPSTLNATAAHNLLGEILRGAKSKHDVYRKLLKASEDILELRPLVDALMVPEAYYSKDGHLYFTEEQMAQAETADRYLTCLFLDYNKVFQPYAKLIQVIQKISDKTIKLNKTLIINEQPNHVKQLYEQKLLANQGTSITLFNGIGNLREDQLKSFIKDLEFFRDKETGKFSIKQGQRSMAIVKLNSIALRLGIPYTSRTLISQIIGKGKNLTDLLRKMEYVYNNTIDYYNKHKGISYGTIGSIRDENGQIPYMNIYEYGSDEQFNTSYMQRLANAFTKYVNMYDAEHKTSLESKVRTKNAKGDSITIFSNINPGFLSQFIKDIQGYAEDKDLAGLRKYLDAKFSHNPAMCDMDKAAQEAKDAAEGKQTLVGTSKFRVKWLNDLYNSDMNNVWSFVQNMMVVRNLGNGTTNKPFEDMSRKEHLAMILSDFVQVKRNSNNAAKLAYYPVFISGDANQHKTITAPIYNDATVIEGLVDMFYQERSLQSQLKAMQEDMQKNGYIPVEAHTDEFALMPVFNTIFAGKDLSRLSKEEVRNAIKEYFDKDGKAFQDFKETCIKYGIVTQVGEDRFRISNSVADIAGKENLDSFLHNFWLNQKFAMAQQMAIMTISPAYYKDLKDLQKRYKETHSSGQKLDMDAMWNGERVFDEADPMQTTLYLAEVTLNGEDIDSDFMEVIAKMNPSVYNDYKKIKSTDGQAYRTIESYRKIAIASNQWSDEAESLYRDILSIRENHTNPDGTINFDAITDEELARISQSTVIFQPIKPFFFSHEKYGFKQDGSEEGNIPVQIKCSEAVLIPELMPKGSRLRHIAEYMTENKIDVTTMTSAIKVGAWGQTDITKATNRKELFEALGKGKVHKLSYKDYIIQVNVPAHEYQQRLFATQIRKLILGGEYDAEIDYFEGKIPTLYRGNGESYVPKSMNKYELKHFYNELLVSNFIDSLKEFLGDVENKDQIANLLIRSILNNDRNSMDSAIGMIIDEKTKDFTIPLCEGIQEHDIVNNLIAVFKQAVNKQTILGGSGVQAASYGLKGYDESDNLHFVTNEDKTNILYAEVEIPLIHKYKVKYEDKDGKIKEKEVDIDYDTYCNPDGTLKEDENGQILIDKDFPGIRDFVAYRIPTERDYSMINCKAVRFTRPTAGITIRVPSQGVTISGFDFDIDKLYFMFKDFHQDKDGKWINYNWEKPAYENPKFTRDNMLIEIIRQRLMDPHTLKERTTPGGFPNASETAKDLMQLMYNQEAYKGRHDLTLEDVRKVRQETGDKDFEPNYDYTDLETLLILNERNQLASKLIGIFANQNTNHVYCAGLSQLTLNEPIAFGQYAEEGLSDLINSPEGVDTYRTLAELLAASVDAVKDPVLGYMNLNILTANAACLLGRLGYDFFDIGLLLNQPVIKYVCEYAQENDVSLDYAINNFIAGIEGKDVNDIEASSPTRSELMYNLVNKDESNIQEDGQIAILRLFEKILADANELNLVVTKTKFTAANAVKPTFGNYYASKADLERFEDFQHLAIRTTGLQEAPIVDTYDIDLDNIPSYLGQLAVNPMAFEQGMYDCMKKAMEKLLEYFPYETDLYKAARELFSHYSRYGNLDEKTINLIHRDLPVFILSSADESFFNHDYNEMVLKEFPQRLLDILKEFPELNELPLFQSLEIRKNKKTDELEISMDFSTSIDEKSDKEAIIESWESMLKHENQKVRDAARLLFLYNFAKTGFGYGPSSFIHYVPTALKSQLKAFDGDRFGKVSYVDFWNNLLGNGSNFTQLTDEQLGEFLRQFIANHLENSKFVTGIYGATAEVLEPYFTTNGEFKTSDEIIEVADTLFENEGLFSNIAKPIYEEDTLIGYTFSPCISFYDTKNQQRVYYMLENISMEPAQSGVYRRVYPIGETNKSLQYANQLINIVPIGEEEIVYGKEGNFETSEETEGETQNPPVQENGSEGEASQFISSSAPTKRTVLDQILNELAIIKTKIAHRGKPVDDSELEEFKTTIKTELTAGAYKTIVAGNPLGDFLNSVIDSLLESSTAKEEALIKNILEKAKKSKLMVLNSVGELEESCS